MPCEYEMCFGNSLGKSHRLKVWSATLFMSLIFVEIFNNDNEEGWKENRKGTGKKPDPLLAMS